MINQSQFLELEVVVQHHLIIQVVSPHIHQELCLVWLDHLLYDVALTVANKVL
jgi:hypothetical protein